MHYSITAESESERIWKNQSTFAKVMGKNQSPCFFLNTVYKKLLQISQDTNNPVYKLETDNLQLNVLI